MRTERCVALVLVAVALAMVIAGSRAQTPSAKPASDWTGSVEVESLEKVAPAAITTAEGWAILWKTWQGQGEVPKVDFSESVVVVTTTRLEQVKVSIQKDDDGNVTTKAEESGEKRPGFRYRLSPIARAGVATVNGNLLVGTSGDFTSVGLTTARPYRPAEVATGSLHLAGSVTMSHLVNLWAEGFGRYHPKLKVGTDFEGSEAGLPELKEDTITLVALSRPVSAAEMQAWEKKLGRKLHVFPVCTDDIAVIVHPANPVRNLSPDQLRMIYAPGEEALTWGKVGLKGEWAGKAMALHGRDEKSGTRQYLRGLAVGEMGAERPSKSHASYRGIVEVVGSDPAAIGYCRAVNAVESVKPVPIGPLSKGEMKAYLRRTCHLVIAVPEGQPIPAVAKELLNFIYRLDGQSLLFRDGFQPLDKDTIGKQLERLGIEDIK